MTMSSLTPPERETVITFSDDAETATVWSAQRRVITKLKKNAAAKLVEEKYVGATITAVFEMPANLVSFRSKRVEQSPEARAKKIAQLKANGAKGRAAAKAVRRRAA